MSCWGWISTICAFQWEGILWKWNTNVTSKLFCHKDLTFWKSTKCHICSEILLFTICHQDHILADRLLMISAFISTYNITLLYMHNVLQKRRRRISQDRKTLRRQKILRAHPLTVTMAIKCSGMVQNSMTYIVSVSTEHYSVALFFLIAFLFWSLFCV